MGQEGTLEDAMFIISNEGKGRTIWTWTWQMTNVLFGRGRVLSGAAHSVYFMKDISRW